MVASHLLRNGRSWSGHEKNCFYLNMGNGRMADISATAGFNFADDSRALLLVDWDEDGDVDIWATNRNAPRLRFLRNEDDSENNYLAIRLQGTTCNRDAIGARVEVHLGDKSQKLIKTVHAGEGFHAQSTKWLNFGLGSHKAPLKVVVRWPDGSIDEIDAVLPNQRYTVVQGSGVANKASSSLTTNALHPSKLKLPKESSTSSVFLLSRVPLPNLSYLSWKDQTPTQLAIGPKPRLINLWASWCQPCLQELHDLGTRQSELVAADLEIIALSVDQLDNKTVDVKTIRDTLRRTKFPFDTGFATRETIDKLEVAQHALLGVNSPLPLPSSFLIDRQGHISAIYRGPIDVQQILDDVATLNGSNRDAHRRAIPFVGRQRIPVRKIQPLQMAMKFFEGGDKDLARDYLEQCTSITKSRDWDNAKLLHFLATLYEEEKETSLAVNAYRQAIAADPSAFAVHRDLGRLLETNREFEAAVLSYDRALSINADDAPTHYRAAQCRMKLGHESQAIVSLRAAWRIRPGMVPVANDLAWLLSTNDEGKKHSAEAVKLATFACRASSFKEPALLDTLAAAYAQDGQFERAAKTAQRAGDLFQAAGRRDAAADSWNRRDIFKLGKPYHP